MKSTIRVFGHYGMEKDTLGTNPTLINTDGDPRNDYAEWLADTDGTNPADWFQITAQEQGQWMAIRFHTSQDRHYTLRRCEDLGEGTWSDEPGFLRIRGRGCPHTFFVRRPASPACFWKVEPGIP